MNKGQTNNPNGRPRVIDHSTVINVTIQGYTEAAMFRFMERHGITKKREAIRTLLNIALRIIPSPDLPTPTTLLAEDPSIHLHDWAPIKSDPMHWKCKTCNELIDAPNQPTLVQAQPTQPKRVTPIPNYKAPPPLDPLMRDMDPTPATWDENDPVRQKGKSILEIFDQITPSTKLLQENPPKRPIKIARKS